jgi:hypothetical protein
VSIKYTNIFQCKTLQNLPKFRLLVWKETIWQPWWPDEFVGKSPKIQPNPFLLTHNFWRGKKQP